MNVEIGAEAALFPEKEYIKRIFVAVRHARLHRLAKLIPWNQFLGSLISLKIRAQLALIQIVNRTVQCTHANADDTYFPCAHLFMQLTLSDLGQKTTTFLIRRPHLLTLIYGYPSLAVLVWDSGGGGQEDGISELRNMWETHVMERQ
jgi:hypothetical protein